MVKVHKKAQTATEYMIILAVVIIIALIVVGVMGGIPGIGTGARSKASAAYWKTAPLAITSYAAKTAGNGRIKLRNNLPNAIIINEFQVSNSGHGDPSVGSTETDITLGPGTEKEFNFATWNACQDKAVGDAWTANIRIEYTDDETGAKYNFTGEGNKLEGTCSS